MESNSHDKPPYCDTGVRNTTLSPLIASIDWFSCTFHKIEKYEDICGILGLNVCEFTVSDKGFNGYRKTAIVGNISILFDPPENTENMGCHVNISGEGCREYEKKFNDDTNWSTFMALCLNFDIHFTRIDIAIDDFYGYFTLKQVMGKVRKGHLTSKFKKARNLEEHLLTDGSTLGQTIYFGKGEVMFRFYDKYQERMNKGYSLNQDIVFWNRYEIQLRGKRATEACKILAYEAFETGQLAKGLFAHYLSFKISNQDSNKSRWKTCDWWTKFLGDCCKISLTQVPPALSVARTKNWLDFQVSTSLAMVFQAFGNDPLLLDYWIALGADRMDDSKVDLIDAFKENTALKLLLRRDMQDYLMNRSVGAL